jgi:Domain of unknown function (DUF4136)
MDKRLFLMATGAAALPWLGGCATLDQLSVELRSFGEWPAGRAPGRYAFDRLPSQQQSSLQQALEDAAASALQAAGFVPAPAGELPDVLVQLGARVSRSDPSPWDDTLWWSGGWGVWRHGPWRGPLWHPRMRLDSPRYDRQVALLLRDRASGRPLYEAQASTEGYQSRLEQLLAPMVRAALADFPASRPEPHAVSVPM